MEQNKTRSFIQYFRRRYKFWTLILAAFLMCLDYLIMLNLTHNQLSFSHMMYIPIVLLGSILGSVYGLVGGIVAGLLAGYFMPYNLLTGEPQYWVDWVFRMSMMATVGLISGLLSRSAKKVRDHMSNVLFHDPNSRLHNINYLRSLNLEVSQSYLTCTLFLGNQETIVDVNGYESYYMYLNMIDDGLKKIYPKIEIILAAPNQVWMIVQQENKEQFIADMLQILFAANILPDCELFVDYAFGISSQKHFKDSDKTKYFIQSDLAAREALAHHITYMTYIDLKTNKQFEYELLSEFTRALSNGQIYMVYQPIIDLKTSKAKALEALIRWEHPIKKMIRPDQFIPAVENTSMIHDMTLQVFDWVLKYATRLLKEKIIMKVSINISTKNLYDERFFPKMIEVFNKYQIKPHNVELEITETVLMDKPEISKRVLERFATFGFRIAIDDFGKGYSSLAYLAQFPINVIKIDRIFTSKILINPATQAIVKATIDLAKQLGYEVLTEGVEDIETADMLTRMGCNSAQGYFYMRPRREDDILEYLRNNR
ncbi:MAG: EAL domain-containing protein [Firmicutes bacterium]|nr:EAL domain-containing protein [Bacillota bacterium]